MFLILQLNRTDKLCGLCFACSKFFNNYHMSLVVRNTVFGVPTRSDTNRAVQLLNMARGLKFRIQKEEGLYYPGIENRR